MLQDRKSGGFPADKSESQEDDSQIDIMELAGALWRGKFIIATCAILTLLIGTNYAYNIAVPTYRSEAALALELRSQPIADIQSVVTGASTEDSAMNTEVEMIQSRRVLRQLVEELNLTQDPEFNAALRPEPRFSIKNLFGSLWALFSSTENNDTQEATDRQSTADDVAALNRTISALRRSITANVQRQTYIFRISATTQSPQKSELIANTLAEIYIIDQINQKYSATENAVTWLSERVVELEEELQTRENALQALRAEIDVVSIEAVEALNRQLIDVRNRVAAARAEVATTEARLSRVNALRETGDYTALADFLDDATLSNLVSDNAAASAIEARAESLAIGVDTSLSRARRQAEALSSSEARIEDQISAQSDDLIQLQQVQRELQTTRTLYETFLIRLKEATVQQGTASADSQIMSEAIPGSYVAPNKGRIMALAMFLGLLAGSLFVLARQFLATGYRSADDLESGTRLPIYGQIPLMPIKKRDELVSYFMDKPASAAAEAVRNLRTALLLSKTNQPPKVIMSTSSLPGEGKTTQAVALAQNLVGLNKRVLLIEGDVRRRTLDEYFKNTPENSEGIISALSVDATAENIGKFIVRDERIDMDIMLGEKTSQNAADIFASTNFADFINVMRDYYDHIIIDTPPVLVVPDALLIGQHCDAIIFNVAWNRTSRVQVKESLRKFSTVNLEVDGLVLSQIDPSGMKRYGYGGKYGSYAAYGSKYYDS